ncbi:hypothetical protein Bca52824_017115 [Brassica carinata]|uniref:Uncharacterized protein n=1 Tax=Brassica carinata TaxID=52824 RepID=A0A8X7VMY9_BRACI|nr:hypothetical protein Bca52824_017115 [Brassica carinata]
MKHAKGKTSKKETHASTEASRMTLSDGETEPPPPMNNPSPSAALPAVTEEIASFNTAQETAPSEETDERYETSIREQDLPKEVAETEDKPAEADPKDLMDSSPRSSPATQLEADNQETVDESPLSLVVATQAEKNVDEENDSEAESESAQKVDESEPNQEIVAVTSSSEAAAVKEGRKKRVLKRLGLRSSKKLKTCASSTPTQSHFLQPEDAANKKLRHDDKINSAIH